MMAGTAGTALPQLSPALAAGAPLATVERIDLAQGLNISRVSNHSLMCHLPAIEFQQERCSVWAQT